MDPLGNFILPTRFVKIIGEIDEFKGRWAALGNLAPERLSALRRIATIESVGSSTRIEGVKLTDDQIERLLSGVRMTSFQSRDEEEVIGYADLLEMIYESYPEIILTENTILQLHSILLKHSAKDQRHRGAWKTLPNRVEAFDENGHSIGVIFETATPFDTPRLMNELVTWTTKAIRSGEFHVLLIIAVFIVRFLAIHPFQDGNGRLSRALTTLLLLRAGYEYVPYSSLERIVEDNKEEYYKTLRRAQTTLDHDEAQLIDWIEFFLLVLLQQKQVLERKIENENLIAPLAPLSEKLLAIVRGYGRITVREATALTGANRNTIKDHLIRLVEAGHLARKGQGRGSWYKKI
ncbi:MAG: Fic family protein [Candidatus Eisenbacteria bacterium]|uniref:Fic family protein n=1 Tax=Eiseniibacteriota bacterium TaxID=2212470 RepID=A0A948RU53_UNCEI|nr:Fic family protein [Candidatus Eisenbacteria bacterium]MBU1949099.1 Fic family protein [Candidatus Eisenbacteria bacterium]MBU2689759.1 Fic family protein [Candidatus Eisenbacteria bacterium]